MKRPAFWIVLGFVSVAAAGDGLALFPAGVLDRRARHHDGPRARARRGARACRARRPGPAGYPPGGVVRADSEAQTFVELEGGGKEAFTRMLRDGLYVAYTWRVRHFQEGETQRDLDPLHARRPAVRVRRDS